jgi:hypothetical protein
MPLVFAYAILRSMGDTWDPESVKPKNSAQLGLHEDVFDQAKLKVSLSPLVKFNVTVSPPPKPAKSHQRSLPGWRKRT